MSSVNNDMKKWLLIGGSVLVVLALIFVGGPYFSASSWKSTALEQTNALVDKVNASNRDISNLSSKLQPTDEDYAKLAAAYTTQMNAVDAAKKDLKEVGGIPGFDITGEYAKTTDARKELVSAYDELVALDKIGLNRTKAEQEVAKLMGGAEPQNEEEAKALVANVKDAAKKVEEFANSANGTDYDKKSADVFNKLAVALEKMFNAADDTEMAAAQEEMNVLVQQADDLQKDAEVAQKAFQKKIDDNIDRINKAVKSLE